MRVKGDGIFSINTSASGGFGNAGISLPETVAAVSGGDSIPITTDLVAHFQADADNTYSDAGSTLAVDGDNIRQINDLSSSSNNLDQASASAQLIFKDDSLQVSNGKYWKANNVDVMTLSSSILMDTSVGCTSFMVCKKDTNSAYPIHLGASNGQTMGWYNNGRVYIGGSPFPAVNLPNNTDWVVLAISVSGATPYTLKLWKDSTFIGSVNSSIVDITLTSAFARSSPLNLNNNEYAELVHYDAPLSDTDVVTVSDWLKTRHSIT